MIYHPQKSNKELILLTRDHCNSGERDILGADVLLDLDLAILGSERETYKDYLQKIRKEYSFLSHAEYKNGRIQILKKFLNCYPLYKTPEMRQLFEVQAKENIRFSHLV